jgi:hypothetical protein
MQLKTQELFISKIYHLIFGGHSWPQVTETEERETGDEGNYDKANMENVLLFHQPQLTNIEKKKINFTSASLCNVPGPALKGLSEQL